MRIKRFFIKNLMLLVLISSSGCANIKKNSEKIYVIEYEELEVQKSLIKNGDKKAIESYNKLINQADKMLYKAKDNGRNRIES